MRCHYEVLGVERQATADEIKKAYRKVALKLHPDKNPDRVEECTRLFAEAQNAYEVLSDTQERAWYDAHREAILRGGVGIGGGHDGLELFQYFSAGCYEGYGDTENSFFGVYAKVFATIRAEDIPHMSHVPEGDYPPFGKATGDYYPTVHEFYAFWQAYATPKPFAWADKYDVRDAPNRQIRRLIEKENEKAREAERRKYNDEVRQLVAFVRKRDPRVKEWTEKQRQLKEEKERLLQERRKEERRQQAAGDSQYKAQAWTEISHDVIEDQIDDEFGTDSSLGSTDDEVAEDDPLYCVVCDRRFRTDVARENHEGTKKHQERLTKLIAELEDDEAMLGGDGDGDGDGDWDGAQSAESSSPDAEDTDTPDEASLGRDKAGTARSDEANHQDSDEDSEGELDMTVTKGKNRRKAKRKAKGLVNRTGAEEMPDVDSLVDGVHDLAVVAGAEERAGQTPEPDMSSAPVSEPGSPQRKLKGKKAKEARKAAREQTSNGDNQAPGSDVDVICQVCKAVFPTRNKLFAHISKTGHAALKTVVSRTGHAADDDDDDWDTRKRRGKKR